MCVFNRGKLSESTDLGSEWNLIITKDRYWHIACTSILLLAFLLRLSAALWWQSKADDEGVLFRFGDSFSYWTLAGRIANGEPFQYGSPDSKMFRVPLYPAFLSLFTRFEPRLGVQLARIAGAALGTVCIYLIMLAARRIADRRAAICSGLLAAIFPGAIGISTFILSEAIFCPLAIGSLVLWQMALSKSATTSSAQIFSCASGLATGLACLTRPSWILWPGMLLLFILVQKESHAQLMKKYFWFLFFAIATMMPWWIRNYQITHRFVPTTLQVGATLYDSLHPGASGGSDENMEWVDRFASEQRYEDKEMGKALSTFEYRLDKRMGNAAIKWALENPSDVATLALLKFWRTWSPILSAEQVSNPWIRIGEAVAYVCILLLSIVGWWQTRGKYESVGLFILPTIYFAGLHLIFVGSIRYRQPAILILCVVAGIGLAWLWQQTFRNRSTANNSG
jgi:4-amino-4-deoxy-L-arabinose transferase-like glycosyltransferase